MPTFRNASERRLAHARALLEGGALEDAAAGFAALLEGAGRERGSVVDGLADALVQLGLARFHGGRDTEAAAFFGKALALRPVDARLRAYRARVFQRAGRFDEAIDDLTRAIAVAPLVEDLYLLLAACLQGRGEPAAASEALERALAVSRCPRLAETARDGAARARAQGPAAAAHESLERREGPQDVEGRSRTRPRNSELASLELAVRERPSWADLRFELGARHFVARRFERAEIELERALRINPSYAKALVLCTRVRLARRDPGAALRRLAPVADAFADLPDLHFWTGVAWFRAGEPERAVVALERAVELNRHFARAQRLLGLVHHGFGRRTEALARLRQGFARDRELEIITLDPESPPLAAGDGGGSGRALAVRPHYPDLHLVDARERSGRGELEHAHEACTRALELNPAYGAAALELARIQIRLGRYGRAAHVLEQLSLRRPEWPDAHALLGRARHLQGDRAGARAALERALGINPHYGAARSDLLRTYDQAIAAPEPVGGER